MVRVSYGDEVEARVRKLLERFLAYVNDELEDSELYKIALNWETPQQVIVRTQLRVLAELSGLSKEQVRDSLNALKDFVEIIEDLREHKRGSEDWHFRLKLWHDKSDKQGNLQNLMLNGKADAKNYLVYSVRKVKKLNFRLPVTKIFP